jgi:hypothetical protein
MKNILLTVKLCSYILFKNVWIYFTKLSQITDIVNQERYSFKRLTLSVSIVGLDALHRVTESIFFYQTKGIKNLACSLLSDKEKNTIKKAR